MAAGHLHELHFTIKCHLLDTMGRGILDLGRLLARVGIDDSARRNTQRLNELNLRLKWRTKYTAVPPDIIH